MVKITWFQVIAAVVLCSSVWGSPKDAGCPPYVLDWAADWSGALQATSFAGVSPSILEHPIEKRGFVEVPLDYANPMGKKIQIFYRVIPSTDATSEKPWMFVVNGGPGYASSAYRKLDTDYGYRQGTGPALPNSDRIVELEKYFRVVLVDQRGTAGQSAPLDLSHTSLRPEVILEYFDANEHARDTAAVIRTIVSKDSPYFVIYQSYGGNVGMQWLGDPDLPLPTGMIFSSSALPTLDGRKLSVERRRLQMNLQQELQRERPEFRQKLDLARQNLHNNGLEPKWVNYLWHEVGWGMDWKTHLLAHLDRLATMSREALLKEFAEERSELQYLNYVLSSAALNPGLTDRTMGVWLQQTLPIEPWMLDEQFVLLDFNLDEKTEWLRGVIEAIDQVPPPATRFYPLDAIKQRLGQTQALFTVGFGDAYIPMELGAEAAEAYRVTGHTRFEYLPGGHKSIFTPAGAQLARDWAAEILSRRTSSQAASSETPSGPQRHFGVGMIPH